MSDDSARGPIAGVTPGWEHYMIDEAAGEVVVRLTRDEAALVILALGNRVSIDLGLVNGEYSSWVKGGAKNRIAHCQAVSKMIAEQLGK